MMTREEYSAAEGVNYSTLKLMDRSPAHYQAALSEPEEDDPVRFAVGNLVHAAVLEGKNLMSQFAIKPKGMSFATTEGKAWKARQTLPILDSEKAELIPRMAEAIANDPEARKLLELCPVREHPIFTEIQGIKCKALLDAYGSDTAKKPLIVDVKTTIDASPRGFSKTIADRLYNEQAAWYSMLTEKCYGLADAPTFAWIVVENIRPFCVQCYYPEPDVWKSGRRKVERALELLMKCRAEDNWPAYGGGLLPISMPKWAND